MCYCHEFPYVLQDLLDNMHGFLFFQVLEICNDDIHELESTGSSLDVLEVVPMKVLFGE